MGDRSPEDILRAWEESAGFWEKHRAAITSMLDPITRAMIDEAGIRSGQSVLDVAGGVGEPALTIARAVGPAGRVTCTDAVAGMVRAAERQARNLGLGNMEFRQCPAESLPFADDSFDVVVSRLGAMFFPDVGAALRELLRVTKPSGRVTLAVWSDREVNPFFRVVADVIGRYIDSPPEDPQAPGAFRFIEKGMLAGLLRAAGASHVAERELKFAIEAPVTLEEFWQLRVEMSETLREKVARLDHNQLVQAEKEVREAAREFFAGDRMTFPAQVLIINGIAA